MESDPRANLLSRLIDPLQTAIKGIRSAILLYGIAVVILLVVLAGLRPEVFQDLLPFFYIVFIAPVIYATIEILLFIERRRKPAAPPAPSEPDVSAQQPPEPSVPVEPSAPRVDAPGRDPTAALQAYLRRLQTVCNTLLLQYIDPKSFESEQMRQQRMQLADVYTTLDTTMQVAAEEQEEGGRRERAADVRRAERETRPLTALQAAADAQQMVLLGEPGSGKSTFVKYLALCLAGELLQPDSGWLARLGDDWPHGPLWPLLVTLRDFARSEQCDGSSRGLWAYIAQDTGEFAPRLRRQLDEGGVLLFMDGLDEVADPGQRARVRDAVAAFSQAHNHPRNRTLVTCRVYAYMQRDERGRYLYQLPEEFAAYTLAEFSDERMDAFIQAWYQEVHQLAWKSQAEATELAARLQEAVRRPGLRVLATRPLLLTVMALLHTTRGRLPDDRVKLYEETVELLLARWQEARLGEESGLSGIVNLDRLETALCQVTYHAHLAQQKSAPVAGEGAAVADIPESTLRQAFAEGCLDGDWNRAGDLIAYVRERAGLLVEHAPGVYTFPHRTFQEYLAAAHLSTLPAFPQEAARLLGENPAQWHEVVMMAVGIMARIKKLPYIALYVVKELCPAGVPETAKRLRAVPEATWLAARHAGEALLEIGIEEARAVDAALVDCARDWLAALLTGGALSPVERLTVGGILDDLGWLPADLDAWVRCPGCAQGGGDLLVGKYPVANAQYARFVAAGGYEDPQWWSKEGWQWRMRPPDYRGDHPATEPQFWRTSRYGRERCGSPAVGVSWYEAEAYCNWLAAQLKEARLELQVLRDGQAEVGALPLGALAVRLPTEAEWAAFCGGVEGDRYPWDPPGDPATTDTAEIVARANIAEAELGGPSPVAMYPLGASQPYGLMDLAGNVWEWTTSEHEAWKGSRVLRGGAFWNEAVGARCGARIDGYDPGYSYRHFGLRCVSSISPSGS